MENYTIGGENTTVTGITQSVYALPNSTNGQVSVTLKGETETNIITNGNFANITGLLVCTD
jgi:hypothetical protein